VKELEGTMFLLAFNLAERKELVYTTLSDRGGTF
jgi:hypothetical protein